MMRKRMVGRAGKDRLHRVGCGRVELGEIG